MLASSWLAYKVMKEKTTTDEKQAMLSELTDVVIHSENKILSQGDKMEAKVQDQAYRIKSLIKN